MADAAERQRRRRARKREGLALFTLELEFAATSEALIEAGYLAWDRAEDAEAVEAALGAMVRWMIDDANGGRHA